MTALANSWGRRFVMTETELAWAAGFLDGEGFFEVRIRERSYRPNAILEYRIEAAQVDRQPLERLQAMFGGSIKLEKERPGARPLWKWNRGGRPTLDVCSALLPYLTVKRDAATRMIDARLPAAP